jgi:hypothetical protein
MNYYAQGGQAHGLKSLAQDLRSYGRDGDTILAHINPQEAGILKALGGSGTINPVTGLPEYRFFKSVAKAVAAPFKAVNEVVKAVPVIGPAIDKGLVSLDKAVGSTIPGGWNTLAQTALAFTPIGLPAKVGLAALGGSGAFSKEGKFNFQKALLSGAMAYGANQLTTGLQNAGSTAYDPSAGLTDATAKAASNIDPSVLEGMTAEQVANAASSTPYSNALTTMPSADVAARPLSMFEAAQSNIDPGFLEGMSRADVAGANVLPSVPNAPGPSFLQQTGANLSAAGRGITNLSGLGTGTVSEAATKFAAPITTTGMTALGVGAMGLASLDEQEKALTQQYQQGQIADPEYNRQMELISEGRRRAEEAVKANPYRFARGGQVDDELGGDYTAMGMDSGNLQKGLFGLGYAAGGMPNLALSRLSQPAFNEGAVGGMQQFAEGGTPRFLSGGGDGMSDSIPATINDKQPARLADGEFVIPADVVSHLGNGSSKAGAKRLYSMMDKVRQARTGKKQQAPEVNTKRLMPA